jgi:hypothetical protein
VAVGLVDNMEILGTREIRKGKSAMEIVGMMIKKSATVLKALDSAG